MPQVDPPRCSASRLAAATRATSRRGGVAWHVRWLAYLLPYAESVTAEAHHPSLGLCVIGGQEEASTGILPQLGRDDLRKVRIRRDAAPRGCRPDVIRSADVQASMAAYRAKRLDCIGNDQERNEQPG